MESISGINKPRVSSVHTETQTPCPRPGLEFLLGHITVVCVILGKWINFSLCLNSHICKMGPITVSTLLVVRVSEVTHKNMWNSVLLTINSWLPLAAIPVLLKMWNSKLCWYRNWISQQKFFEEVQDFKPRKVLLSLLELHNGTGWAKIMAWEASISSSAKGSNERADLTGLSWASWNHTHKTLASVLSMQLTHTRCYYYLTVEDNENQLCPWSRASEWHNAWHTASAPLLSTLVRADTWLASTGSSTERCSNWPCVTQQGSGGAIIWTRIWTICSAISGTHWYYNSHNTIWQIRKLRWTRSWSWLFFPTPCYSLTHPGREQEKCGRMWWVQASSLDTGKLRQQLIGP